MELLTIPAISILFGLFGLLVGSFLNVVILRQETQADLGGRSHCPLCNNQLRWYELIPVVSFVIQRGKCRNCKSAISRQYILGEIITGIVFGMSGYYLMNFFVQTSHPIYSIAGVIALLVTVSFAVAITVYDTKTQLVPVRWMLYMAAFSIIFLTASYGINGFETSNLWMHVMGLLVAVPFLLIWIISRGKWMGFADIEIIAWMGLFLGPWMGTSAVLLAFYSGAVFAVCFIIYNLIKGYSYKTTRAIPIPFAPFLLVAWFVTVITSWNIFSLFARLVM